MKDKVIIIGGDSYLARQFIAANQDKFWFTVFSRKATGFRDETVLDDFFQIQLPQCKGAVVINFAAIVHNSKAAPELYQKINYELPLFLAQKSTEAGVYLFIQISTIAVYGSSAIINVITSYSIHYTKLYDPSSILPRMLRWYRLPNSLTLNCFVAMVLSWALSTFF